MTIHSHTHSRAFFASPHPAGRKITAGFTYLQRIGKSASYDVWFPDGIREQLSPHFPAEWAAVRQFELLQESGNHKIYDLDAGNLKRATLDLARGMRAGGYRITVATLGAYEDGGGDELEILDQHLQERISQMIHMLYLDMQSDEENARNAAALAAGGWDYRRDLPHVGMVLGAQDLFAREEGKEGESKGKKKGDRHRRARQFFDILQLLPQKHIVHDTVIGLQLPELNGENQWNYIAAADETLAAFNGVLNNVFRDAVFHLRGYGDRLTESSELLYRRASLALH